MKFYKEILFFAVLLIGIQIIMTILAYEKALALSVLALFLAFLSFILAVKDLHSMKGLHPKERFYLSLLLFFANIIGLIIYVFYSKYLQERSERTLKNKEDRWHELIQQNKGKSNS